MNRTINILKRLYVVMIAPVTIAIGLLAVHSIARLLWVIAKIGENYNYVSATSIRSTATSICAHYTDGTYTCRAKGPDATVVFFKEAVRTFWNYSTDGDGVFATHMVAIFVIVVALVAISVISYVLIGRNVLLDAAYAYSASITRAHASTTRPNRRYLTTADVHRAWARR